MSRYLYNIFFLKLNKPLLILVLISFSEFNLDQSVVKKRGGHTINAKLPSKREELMVLGKTFDIQFPPPYFKLCGKHAKYFKAEATVCIRHKAPLKVKTWKEIPEDDLTIMWKHMEVSITLLM